MSEKKSRNSETSNINIEGDVPGQIAIGKHISQTQIENHNVMSHIEFGEIQQLLQKLRARVETEVVSKKKDAALERVDELEQAIIEEAHPDLTTMEYVKKWFGKNVPALAGMVTSVVVHPIVGKLVEAGGDMLVRDFQRKFGEEA